MFFDVEGCRDFHKTPQVQGFGQGHSRWSKKDAARELDLLANDQEQAVKQAIEESEIIELELGLVEENFPSTPMLDFATF